MAKINTRPSTDAFEGGDINFKRPSQAKEIIRRLKKNKGAMVGLIFAYSYHSGRHFCRRDCPL